MKSINGFFIFLILLILSACQSTSESTADSTNDLSPIEAQAKMDLITFFEKLNQAKYQDAIPYYGGSYEVLQGYNPDIDPQDKVTLMQYGCEFNGLTCLQVYDAEILNRISETEFLYKVRFSNLDGEIFVLGPCCGATEEEMPPVSLFEIRVTCDSDSNCKVLDLPPYVP
ncbi:MAG TPA: hypothetical protein VK856_04030 [Anaerolineaceae bacterium]|nr:hypothetical protein [Anaerolineaceae bacterium]